MDPFVRIRPLKSFLFRCFTSSNVHCSILQLSFSSHLLLKSHPKVIYSLCSSLASHFLLLLAPSFSQSALPMEMVIETIPRSLNQSGRTGTECRKPISVKQTDQEPEISGLEIPQNGNPDRLQVPGRSNQSGEVNSDCKTDQTPQVSDLEMPKNGSPHCPEVPKCPNQRGKTKSDCKTPILVKETEGKLRISDLDMPENGTPDRPEVVAKSPIQSGKVNPDCKTHTPVKQTEQKSPFSGIELPKNGTPDRLKVPKAFKYPERYMSPTDLMMSPITRGLLARSRKGAVLLPPSKNQLKIHDLHSRDESFISELNGIKI